MSTIESLVVFSEAVRTSAAACAGAAPCVEGDRKASANQWDSLVQSKLVRWDESAETPAEEGLLPPTRQALGAAFQVAARLCDAGVPPPTRLVQDGAGGIVFEWKYGSAADKLHLDPSGGIEATKFCDSRLIYRHPVSFN
jgi:hypothetical protein